MVGACGSLEAVAPSAMRTFRTPEAEFKEADAVRGCWGETCRQSRLTPRAQAIARPISAISFLEGHLIARACPRPICRHPRRMGLATAHGAIPQAKGAIDEAVLQLQVYFSDAAGTLVSVRLPTYNIRQFLGGDASLLKRSSAVIGRFSMNDSPFPPGPGTARLYFRLISRKAFGRSAFVSLRRGSARGRGRAAIGSWRDVVRRVLTTVETANADRGKGLELPSRISTPRRGRRTDSRPQCCTNGISVGGRLIPAGGSAPPGRINRRGKMVDKAIRISRAFGPSGNSEPHVGGATSRSFL